MFFLIFCFSIFYLVTPSPSIDILRITDDVTFSTSSSDSATLCGTPFCSDGRRGRSSHVDCSSGWCSYADRVMEQRWSAARATWWRREALSHRDRRQSCESKVWWSDPDWRRLVSMHSNELGRKCNVPCQTHSPSVHHSYVISLP